jgi:hypothetical protein
VEAVEEGGLEDGVGDRNESLRRKEEKFMDREGGGGEFRGESWVISTDRVGENETGANSGAHPMGFKPRVEGIECDAIGCEEDAFLSMFVVFMTIGLLRFISVAVSSAFTLGGSGRVGSGA